MKDLKKYFAKVIRENYPSKAETYGMGYVVDILEYGICKFFNKHQYNKFSPILCESDQITSSLAGLEMIRTGTIANEAQKCDFRYKLVKR